MQIFSVFYVPWRRENCELGAHFMPSQFRSVSFTISSVLCCKIFAIFFIFLFHFECYFFWLNWKFMLDDMAPQDIDLRKNIRYNTTLTHKSIRRIWCCSCEKGFSSFSFCLLINNFPFLISDSDNSQQPQPYENARGWVFYKEIFTMNSQRWCDMPGHHSATHSLS